MKGLLDSNSLIFLKIIRAWMWNCSSVQLLGLHRKRNHKYLALSFDLDKVSIQTTDVYVCHANPKFLLALCKYLFLFKQFFCIIFKLFDRKWMEGVVECSSCHQCLQCIDASHCNDNGRCFSHTFNS